MTPENLENTIEKAARFKKMAARLAEAGVVVVETVPAEFASLMTQLRPDTLGKIGIAYLPDVSQVTCIFSKDTYELIKGIIRNITKRKGSDLNNLMADLYEAVYTLVQASVNPQAGAIQAVAEGQMGILISSAQEEFPDFAGTIELITQGEYKTLNHLDENSLSGWARPIFQKLYAIGHPKIITMANSGYTPDNMFKREG